MPRNLWSKDELVKVLRLYCLLPFGQIHSKNPKIIAISNELGRSPSAIALKMVNFASLDPTISQGGMKNSSALDKAVWDEFFSNIERGVDSSPQLESGFSEPSVADFYFGDRVGLDIENQSTRRVNQNFFREMILAAYNNKCAITGIDDRKLLVASHILPWAGNSSLRLNPQNGLCLNPLHDRAFECGLIAVDETYCIMFSPRLPDNTHRLLRQIAETKLMMPSRFLPNPEFLAEHRRVQFQM